MGCEAQLARKCLFTPILLQMILTYKVGQTDLVFGVHQASLVSLCRQHYKSVCRGYDLCHPG